MEFNTSVFADKRVKRSVSRYACTTEYVSVVTFVNTCISPFIMGFHSEIYVICNYNDDDHQDDEEDDDKDKIINCDKDQRKSK